jgi:hypothetical protein
VFPAPPPPLEPAPAAPPPELPAPVLPPWELAPLLELLETLPGTEVSATVGATGADLAASLGAVGLLGVPDPGLPPLLMFTIGIPAMVMP